jgi:hypothetical protein
MDEIVLREVLEEDKMTFASGIRTAMHCAEIYGKEKELTGGQKLDAAKDVLEKVVEMARIQGMLTYDEALELRQRYEQGIDVVEDIIEAYIAISKNPAVLQTVESVKKCIDSGCLKRKRAKK